MAIFAEARIIDDIVDLVPQNAILCIGAVTLLLTQSHHKEPIIGSPVDSHYFVP